MKSELLDQLYKLVAEGKHPSPNEGTCQIDLYDELDNFSGFFHHYDNELRYTQEFSGKPDVVVKMKPDTLSSILSNLEQFDLRDRNIVSQVDVQGKLALATFLFNAIKRTPKEILGRIAEAEGKWNNRTREVTEVKRIHKPSRDEMFSLMNEGAPFVVTGILEDWEFLSADLGEIKSKYGSVKLRSVVEDGKVRYETLKDFIDKMENNKDGIVYTDGCDVPQVMWSKFRLPFFNSKFVNAPLMWMGSSSGNRPCTELHRDCHYGMLTNTYGQKKLILFSPDQSKYLYPIGAFNLFQVCAVRDVQNVDLDKYPLFKHAYPLEIMIGPGESLIIPAFWYHCVYALENVFSVSHGLNWGAWEVHEPSAITA